MKKMVLMSMMAVAAMVWSSCSYDCHCTKETGCVTMLARRLSDDSLLKVEVACADSNARFDSTYLRQVSAFFHDNHSDSVKLTHLDTGKIFERITIRAREKHPEGFDCICPR